MELQIWKTGGPVAGLVFEYEGTTLVVPVSAGLTAPFAAMVIPSSVNLGDTDIMTGYKLADSWIRAADPGGGSMSFPEWCGRLDRENPRPVTMDELKLSGRAWPGEPEVIEGWVEDTDGWGTDPDGLEYCLDQLSWRRWPLALARVTGYRPNINWGLCVPGFVGVPGEWDELSQKYATEAGVPEFLLETLKEEGLQLKKLKVRKEQEAPVAPAVSEVAVQVQPTEKPAPARPRPSKLVDETGKPVPLPRPEIQVQGAMPVPVPVQETRPEPPAPRHVVRAAPRHGLKVMVVKGKLTWYGSAPAWVSNAAHVKEVGSGVLEKDLTLDPQEILDALLDHEKERHDAAPVVTGESRADRRLRTALGQSGWQGEFGPPLRRALENMLRKGGKSLVDCLLELRTAPAAELPFMSRPPEERAAAIKAAREAAEIKKLQAEEDAAQAAQAIEDVKQAHEVPAEVPAAAVADVVKLPAQAEAPMVQEVAPEAPAPAEVAAAEAAVSKVEELMKGLDQSLHVMFQARVGAGEDPDVVALDLLTAPVAVEKTPAKTEKKRKKG